MHKGYNGIRHGDHRSSKDHEGHKNHICK
jgi:hypothetical protein